MFNQAIAFEHPLNERIRTFLRLEHLFDKIDYCLPKPEEWATRAVIDTLLDLVNITGSDIKPQIIQELERYITVLGALEQQNGVDPSVLQQYLANLQATAEDIRCLGENTGQILRDSEFIKSVMQRSSIPGGTCSFDLPHYNYWLRKPQAQRRQQVDVWMQDLLPIRDGVGLLLSLVRNSCDPKEVTANSGLYQQTLDAKLTVQMLRIRIDPDLALFPEVSGHKHRFNIRFMETQDTAPVSN